MLFVAVNDAAKQIRVDRRQRANAGYNVRSTAATNTEDVQNAVRSRRDRRRVVHIEHRRRVDEDDVVLFAERREHLVKFLTGDEFRGRPLRTRARRHDLQILNRNFRDSLFQRAFAEKNVRKAARIVQAEHFMNIRLAHIAVDKENALARFRNLNGEVRNDHRFTVGRVRARIHNDDAARARTLVKQTRAQLSEDFADSVVRLIVRKQFRLGFVRVAKLLALLRRNVAKTVLKGDKVRENRHMKRARNFRGRVERRVGNVDKVRQKGSKRNAKHKTGKHELQDVRVDRMIVLNSRGQDFDLIRIDVAHKRELLQVLIEMFKHRLRRLDRNLHCVERFAVLRNLAHFFVAIVDVRLDFNFLFRQLFHSASQRAAIRFKEFAIVDNANSTARFSFIVDRGRLTLQLLDLIFKKNYARVVNRQRLEKIETLEFKIANLLLHRRRRADFSKTQSRFIVVASRQGRDCRQNRLAVAAAH